MTRSNPSVSREFRLSFIESPQGTTTSVNFCRDICVVKKRSISKPFASHFTDHPTRWEKFLQHLQCSWCVVAGERLRCFLSECEVPEY